MLSCKMMGETSPNFQTPPPPTLVLAPISLGVPFPTISNGMMATILQQLETAIFGSIWDIKITCLEALAKISFFSDFEVKLHLFSFFMLLYKDEEVGLSTEVLPILQILQTVFDAFEAHAECGIPITEINRKKILQGMSQYCNMPTDFNPIGVTFV
eukprot:TRINITY_DN2711_c0_g4_i3.p1 TRINITY_DN2711_c0_g4~~TRINITY_DN2711_c0_g4_i3.p1  ORF type:complete len:156 (-),score=34.00 TRINITY_DN2711_c0_g4_i3:515-982(-)